MMIVGKAIKGAKTIRKAASYDSIPEMYNAGTIKSTGMRGRRRLYSLLDPVIKSPSS
jgi:hypothetical protein